MTKVQSNKNPAPQRRRYPKWWQEGLAQLSERDPVMAGLIARYPRSRLRGSRDPFRVLANSIIGQQISVKAADSIRERIENICPIESQTFASIKIERLRECGLSRPKTEYLTSLARWFTDNKIDARWFARRDTQTVHDCLLEQRGIGEWTWQMFAIFYLMDSNILPRADVGLWQGIEAAYNVKRDKLEPKIKRLEKLWTPYCTAAVWFLWTSRDPEEISY
ncbi:MAG: DNA-3-methyladenine glycosylase 2 family protein [Proteobacteria bacterium]|nr:DNA-3-methyladenine glycosylase 2 family protein [Pseudomonadota bacterium]